MKDLARLETQLLVLLGRILERLNANNVENFEDLKKEIERVLENN